MTAGQPGPAGQVPGDGPSALAVIVALATLVLAFLVQGLAIFLALVLLVWALVLLIRRRRHPQRRGLAIGTVVLAVLALVIAGATAEQVPPAPQAAAPPPDPFALPARVVVATVNAPDDLVTDTGRRLHVPTLRWYRGPDACRVAAGRTATSALVAGKQVTIAAPGPAPVDPGAAVPPGAQAVALTLPDGQDYVRAWTALAPRTSRSTCSRTTTTPPPTTTTTTEEPVPTTVEEQEDVDRPYVPDVPAPRTRARSGQSGHPCLPGERDGDKDGYCGEG